MKKKNNNKKYSIDIIVFGYENKVKISTLYVKKYFQKTFRSIINRKKVKNCYAFIEDLNKFIYGHILHCGRKHFCRYCLQAFRTEEILKTYITDCFKIDGKQMIKTPKNGEYINFKNFDRKIKSPFMIYANLESILVPEDNGKQNPDESYTTKYQNMVLAVMVIK